ncbi:MAG: DHH family phosphoesterase [Bacillota bacterium]
MPAPLDATYIREIVEEIAKNTRFLVFTHEVPDGDTIGSSLALAAVLRQVGKQVFVVSADGVPEVYRFLPGAAEVLLPEEVPLGFARGCCAVLVDCGEMSRSRGSEELLQVAHTVINIDHHVSNTRFGHIWWVDTTASSVGEMVFYLIKAMGCELSPAVATCLYTAVCTDTGSFRYSNTTARCLEVASELVKSGAKPDEVSEHVYETKSVSSLRLLGVALGNLQLHPSGKIAWITLSLDEMAKVGASEEESEGLVNYARSVRGVEVGIVFRETPGGSIKVGFRSRKHVDVAKLAEEFGGGGHPRASGCTITSQKLEHVVRVVVDRVAAVLGL